MGRNFGAPESVCVFRQDKDGKGGGGEPEARSFTRAIGLDLPLSLSGEELARYVCLTLPVSIAGSLKRKDSKSTNRRFVPMTAFINEGPIVKKAIQKIERIRGGNQDVVD